MGFGDLWEHYRKYKYSEELEPDAYWTCSFCGYTENLGTTDECIKCKGIRRTA